MALARISAVLSACSFLSKSSLGEGQTGDRHTHLITEDHLLFISKVDCINVDYFPRDIHSCHDGRGYLTYVRENQVSSS